MRTLALALAASAAMATSALAGDFSTSGVAYVTPDFTAAGGSRTVTTPQSALFRFPLVTGAEYTVSYAATGTETYSVAVYDFVAPEAPTGDPFRYPSTLGTGVIVTRTGFNTSGSATFTSLIDGFGTIELSNFSGSSTEATVSLVSNISAVPLPAAGLMLLGGLGAMSVVGRRRKSKAKV